MMRPDCSPSTSIGTTSLPYNRTTLRTGLTNSALRAPHRMRLAMGSAAIACATMLPSNLNVAAPGSVPRNASHAPLSLVSRSRSSTRTPQLLANALAACIEGAGHRRAAPLHAAIRSVLGAAIDSHGQPARRRESMSSAMWNRGAVEALEQAVLECDRQAEQRARRQFLRAQLEQ